MGPIRQEVLSGVRRPEVFEALRSALSRFAHLGIEAADYDRAAEFFDVCRGHGIAGGPIDIMIGPISSRRG
jgi:hypothetical protein